MTDPCRKAATGEEAIEETVDGLTELEGEELIEVVRQTVDDLQRMLDRLQRYVGDDDDKDGEGS